MSTKAGISIGCSRAAPRSRENSLFSGFAVNSSLISGFLRLAISASETPFGCPGPKLSRVISSPTEHEADYALAGGLALTKLA